MLASGRPIVVAAAAGTELADFVAGAAILVPPGDADALASAIGEAASGPADGEGCAARLALARTLSQVDGLRAAATAATCPNDCPGRREEAGALSAEDWLCPCARRRALWAAAAVGQATAAVAGA